MTLGSEIRAPAVAHADEVVRKDIDVQLVDPLAVDGAQYGTVEPHMTAASVKRLKEKSRLKQIHGKARRFLLLSMSVNAHLEKLIKNFLE